MRQSNEQIQQQSFYLLTSIYLMKKSIAAYQHAKSTVEQESPIANEVCYTCLSVCRDCLGRLQEMNMDKNDQRLKICKVNVKLCEDLYAICS